jgi:hypothetical protein
MSVSPVTLTLRRLPTPNIRLKSLMLCPNLKRGGIKAVMTAPPIRKSGAKNSVRRKSLLVKRRFPLGLIMPMEA